MTMDLRQEMHAATAELTPSSDLAARGRLEGRRRLRARRQVMIVGTFVVLAVVGLGSVYLASGRPSYPVATPPSPTATPSATGDAASPSSAVSTAEAPSEVLTAVHDFQSSWSGSVITKPVQWVRTLRQTLAAEESRLGMPHDGPGAGNAAIYVIQIEGALVCRGCLTTPLGQTMDQRGTVAILTVPVEHPELGGQGIDVTRTPINLAALGDPQTFAASS
jgi:hypothetical protein